MTSSDGRVVRTSSGSIDLDHHRDLAACARSAFLQDLARTMPGLSPMAKRRLNTLVAAFVVATAAFWATMLTDPPRTEAGTTPGAVLDVMRTAPLDLPSIAADPI